MPETPPPRGGAEAAIQRHYDVSDAFYALWLDPTMTYSCALWRPGDDPADLHAAQLRKLDFHLDAAGAPRARHLLDIGCGWGSLMRRASAVDTIETVTGLTLSDTQARHIAASGTPRAIVRKESWIDHRPDRTYGSIVSIGAFEHFASPGDSTGHKTALYREFLARCRSWLAPDGALSLQTICYGSLRPSQGNAFITEHIFPDSELPEPHEIVHAASGIFEVTALRNDRVQYARTCELWLANLRRRRAEAAAIVGEETVVRYEKYLRMSAFGFNTGRIGLLRLTLKPGA